MLSLFTITEVFSVTAALIAAIGTFAAALVSAVLLVKTTSPDVIIYSEQDEEEPHLLYLLIENIGNGIALNIDFKLSREIHHEVVWFGKPLVGAFTTGIPSLPPGGKRKYIWGDIDELRKHLGGKSIVCDISFYGRFYPTILERELTNTCVLEAESYRDSVDQKPGQPYRELIRELEKVREILTKAATMFAEQLRDIRSAIKDIPRSY